MLDSDSSAEDHEPDAALRAARDGTTVQAGPVVAVYAPEGGHKRVRARPVPAKVRQFTGNHLYGNRIKRGVNRPRSTKGAPARTFIRRGTNMLA